ncbi:flavin reductase family protein [Chloroflexota bacterium]
MKIDPSSLDWRGTHHLMMGALVPRPIAFVSTVNADGINNLAPFSCFAPICQKPTLFNFSISTTRDGRRKDTINNIEATWEFVLNVVTEDIAEQMNQASYPYSPEVDEFEKCRLTPVKADLVKPPMVGESPVNIECRVRQVLEFGEGVRRTHMVIGEVLRVHVRDELYVEGRIQPSKLKAVGRLGEDYYCYVRDIFEMKRPYQVD